MAKMNLMAKLMEHDRAEATRMKRKTIPSTKMSELIGEPAEIEIRALTPREIGDINEFATDADGNMTSIGAIESNFYACSKAIENPDLKDKDLQSHYGARNAQELCEILFGMEAAKITEEVMELSGIDIDENDIKN